MIRPRNFHSNPQTAGDNRFQNTNSALNASEINKAVIDEFDRMVEMLKDAGINVSVFDQHDAYDTPDALFPNNWFSTDTKSRLFLYPMKAPNRRLERRKDVIGFLRNKYPQLHDLSFTENEGRFLEGTGSLVLDNKNKIAYACASERTDPKLVESWCREAGYVAEIFTATDVSGIPVYHTNVVMSIGNGFAMASFDAIPSDTERERVRNRIMDDTNRELIELTRGQMADFVGNGLQLITNDRHPLFVLSERAWKCLHRTQQETILSHSSVITPQLTFIEQLGGGSARCMMAELF